MQISESWMKKGGGNKQQIRIRANEPNKASIGIAFGSLLKL